jgi:hypothetical protein
MKKESVRVSTSVNSQYLDAEGRGGQISTVKHKGNGLAAPRKKNADSNGVLTPNHINKKQL